MADKIRINKIRAELIKRLKKGDKPVMSLYWDVKTTWYNCLYHLRVLEKGGYVQKKVLDDGRLKVWSLTDEGHKVYEEYA